MQRYAVALVSLALVGCYAAEFDEDADGVFACEERTDCNAEFSCVRGFCVSDRGPVVTIVGPEENSSFDADLPVVFPLAVSGSGLTLDEPNGTPEPERGYLRIEVDGVLLPNLLISGSLEGSVTETLDLGVLAGGFHRIRVAAYGLDHEPYENPSAAADVGVWVNDGQPHVAVRTPWPGDTFTGGAPLDVAVGCLNCTFVDPLLAAADRVDDPVPEGHTHVYLDRRQGVPGVLDYPACLPVCNFDYATNGSIKPDNESGQAWVQGAVLQVPTEPGSLRVTASFTYTGHIPYPADNLDPASWGAMPGIMEQLVYDSIEIRLE